MNVLPFLFFMLLVFSLIALSAWQSTLGMKHFITAAQEYDGLETKDQRIRVAAAFDKFPIPKAIDQPANQTVRTTRTPRYFREKETIHENTKLFISALFTDTGSEQQLYDTTLALLNHCYGSIATKTSLEELLNVWITKGTAWRKTHQGLQDTLTWTDLFPDEPKLKELHYQLLQGTRVITDGGFPPLGDLISIADSKYSAYFYYSRPEVVQALFGEEMATKIFDLEKQLLQQKKHYRCLKKIELEALANGRPLPNIKFGKITRKQPIEKILLGKKTQVTARLKTSEGSE